MTNEPNGLWHRLAANQDSVFNSASRAGPTEVYARFTRRTRLDFDSSGIVSIQERNGSQIAVRVVRGHRIGIAGGSLTEQEGAGERLVNYAEQNARDGQPSTTAFAPVRQIHGSPTVRYLRAVDIVDGALELVERLRQEQPTVFWGGSVCVTSRSARIIHTEGFDGQGSAHFWKLDLRGRQTVDGLPVDRLIEVGSQTWPKLIENAMRRIGREFPPGDGIANCNQKLPTAIGAALLSKILQWLIRNRDFAEQCNFLNEISVWDRTLSRDGCDDEGISIKPVPMLENGTFRRWETLLTVEGDMAPAGRGLRPSIDMHPEPTAIALEWVSPCRTNSPSYVLLRELAAMAIDDKGVLRGTAPETILVESGRAVRTCRGQTVAIPLRDLFGLHFGGASSDRFAAHQHLLPDVILQ